MPKRRTKKTMKETESIPNPQTQTQPPQFIDIEIQAMKRQIGAIRAVRDVEIEHLLTELHLLRSCFSSEELQKPMLQVFEETLPNLRVVNDEHNKKFEVKWRESEGCNDGEDLHAALLHRFSIASIPHFPGLEYSTNSGRMSFISTDNLHFKDVVMEEPSDTQTLAVPEGLHTPGVTSQRLSLGMTPKTLRLPKPGEMLLSVHGSPLGVYKDHNMEAIHGPIAKGPINSKFQNLERLFVPHLLKGSEHLLSSVQSIRIYSQLQIWAVRVVRDVQIEHLLMELCFLRSRFSSAELQKLILQVFEETLTNLYVVNDERNKKFKMKWRKKEGCNDGEDSHASFLQRFSTACMPHFPDLEYSTNSGAI
ncbi:hypothetical protein VNO78_34972 [Psophocarpus tetragonolobus]|uniref:Borealin C-terminal domain-containing protein n=1 Tax=Psophocarpus tetragonolobus TaxID=3891 RepID=A0AAN9NUM0_PSOTE